MTSAVPYFVPPGFVARMVNRAYGRLTRFGLSPSYSYLVQTEGRKTGRVRSTPVNLLRVGTRLYLVGTRGHTHWSRNVIASGNLALKRGRTLVSFRCHEVPNENKPEILKTYLIRFNWMVWRFFPVRSDADLSAFASIADRYPVFELSPQTPPIGDAAAAVARSN
jgi:deazaflavin-dependent oxidoreductase (nitroreductase family)